MLLLESWKTWILAVLHATEEIFVSPFQKPQFVLQGTLVHLSQPIQLFLESSEVFVLLESGRSFFHQPRVLRCAAQDSG